MTSSLWTSILRAAGATDRRIAELAASGRLPTNADAMNLAAAMERLAVGGLGPEEIDALFPAFVEADLSVPQKHADAVAALARRLKELGVEHDAAMSMTLCAARAETAGLAEAAAEIETSLRAGLAGGLSAGAAGRLTAGLLGGGTRELTTRVEAALAARRATGSPEPSAQAAARELLARRGEPRAKEGGRTMSDSEKRNGADLSGRFEKERERLEREREALERERENLDRERERADREREKLDREREKLDRLQEELEQRLERQEERLEELEDALEERMDALDEAAAGLEGLEDIEVEGIEGVREMLDVVSDRLPHLMRGIQESIYSAERLQTTAEAFATFFRTLKESGMPDEMAAQMTKMHFGNLERQMHTQMAQHRPPSKRRHGPGSDFDPLGPNFDPLGPNFDPLGRTRRGAPRPTHRPPEPCEPCEPCSR